ncbi:MAG: hypothetical protein OXC48_11300 [Endozoicomonadaceae bacterium]|nr:hypothetical protein [Endozoicomonadaceae bacterium]
MVSAIWYAPENNNYIPVDFRICNEQSDGKIKNDHNHIHKQHHQLLMQDSG